MNARTVVLAAAAFAAVYIVLDLNAFYALRTGQNTGLYLQSLVNLAHHGTTFDQNDGRPHLAVHDQWLALVLTPLVAVFPYGQTLIVAQVVLLAAGVPLLYLFARSLGLAAAPAACLGLVYLIAPSTQGWAYHAFVPEDALPALAFGLGIALARKQFVAALVVTHLILGIKEDEVFFLAWIGAYVAFALDRRTGLGMVALAVLNGAAYYGIESALGFAPEHPVYALADGDLGHQLAFLAEILAPLAFAPLMLGARMLLVLPFAAELFLTQDRSYPLYQAGSYYTIPLVTFATIGAAVAIARRPALARWALGCAVLMALFLNTTVLHLGRRPFSRDPQFDAAARYAGAAVAVDFPCADAGAWTVAASDPNARLACPGTATASILPADDRPARPAWRDVPLDSPAAWAK